MGGRSRSRDLGDRRDRPRGRDEDRDRRRDRSRDRRRDDSRDRRRDDSRGRDRRDDRDRDRDRDRRRDRSDDRRDRRDRDRNRSPGGLRDDQVAQIDKQGKAMAGIGLAQAGQRRPVPDSHGMKWKMPDDGRGDRRRDRSPGGGGGRYSRDPLGSINIPPPDKGPRPGDWCCSKCGANVFSFKPRCTFCGTPKPRPEPPKEITCDVCKQKMPRNKFSKVTCDEIDELEVPPQEDDEVPNVDAGRAYVGKIARRNEDRGFGFAECHPLKKKYERDILIQRSDIERIEQAAGGPKLVIGARILFGVEQKNEGFTAHSVSWYEIMCKDCMSKKLPSLHSAQMEAQGEVG